MTHQKTGVVVQLTLAGAAWPALGGPATQAQQALANVAWPALAGPATQAQLTLADVAWPALGGPATQGAFSPSYAGRDAELRASVSCG